MKWENRIGFCFVPICFATIRYASSLLSGKCHKGIIVGDYCPASLLSALLLSALLLSALLTPTTPLLQYSFMTFLGGFFEIKFYNVFREPYKKCQKGNVLKISRIFLYDFFVEC